MCIEVKLYLGFLKEGEGRKDWKQNKWRKEVPAHVPRHNSSIASLMRFQQHSDEQSAFCCMLASEHHNPPGPQSSAAARLKALWRQFMSFLGDIWYNRHRENIWWLNASAHAKKKSQLFYKIFHEENIQTGISFLQGIFRISVIYLRLNDSKWEMCNDTKVFD